MKRPALGGRGNEATAELLAGARPAEFHFNTGLLAVFGDCEPLQVVQVVPAAANERLAMVHLIAAAGPRGLVGGWAWVRTHEVGAQRARPISGRRCHSRPREKSSNAGTTKETGKIHRR